MSLKIDVLPAPLRPMMPHRSPSATVKVMFLKSSVAPKETPMLESERRVTQRRLDRTTRVAAESDAEYESYNGSFVPLIRISSRICHVSWSRYFADRDLARIIDAPRTGLADSRHDAADQRHSHRRADGTRRGHLRTGRADVSRRSRAHRRLSERRVANVGCGKVEVLHRGVHDLL